MKFNGVDLEGLCEDVEALHYPKTVPGRTVHIDADFLAYQVSYEKEDEPKTIEDMHHNADIAIDTLRQLAGAERSILYLTPSGSNKGDRYKQVTIKEYQGNRKDKPKPRFLGAIRDWMHNERGAVNCMNYEADDGMAMAQYAAIRDGREEQSVIASKDKDLRMVPGLQLDWSTGYIGGTPADKPFGSVWVEVTEKKHPETGKVTKTKKVRGSGWKFFWLQMLMGDTADNISGLPKVHGHFLNKFKPTAASAKNPNARKPGLCGQILAFDILENVKTNHDAAKLVKALYKANPEGYVHWKTGEPVPYGKAFLGEAQALWMRRQDDHLDVLKWMKEECG